MNKKTNIIALVIFTALFFTICAANIFQPARATVSEEEKRELAKFPKFTFESLLSGEYFSGIDAFITDTFIFRNELISVSRKINSLWSANTFFGSDDDEIIFINSNTPTVEVDIDTPIIITDKVEKEEPDKTKDEIPDEPTTAEPNDTVEDQEKPNVDSEPVEENQPSKNEPEEGNSEDLTEDKEPEDKVPSENKEQADPPTNDENSQTDQTIEPSPSTDMTEIADPVGVGEAEYLSNGEFIYNGAVYTIPYLVKDVANYYADVIGYYKYLFPDARISTLCAPLASSMIDDPKLKKKITDQDKMINTINSYLDEDINGINCFDELYSHRDEYLYYRSDHHWTSRGAYYAYVAFAESLDLEPTPLENFTEVLMNSKWKGSMYAMTGDERVKELSDEVYAYVTTKKHTMTTYNSKGVADKFNTSILTGYASYDGFINGDNAYTVINVPENPKEMTILVFKDSYGNAFVPYLVEHYGTIIVVDPRHIYFDIHEHLKDYPLKDILFVNNLYNPNVLSYPKNLMRAVGQ